jgi:hypothetical protein
MKSVPPVNARPIAAKKPPCWPPAVVLVSIWMLGVSQESSPVCAKTFSPGFKVTSRTGIVVPMIRCCIAVPPL